MIHMIRSAIVLLALILALQGSACAENIRLMVASDLHHLAAECYETSEGLFEASLRRGDGKMSHYSRELLLALEEEAAHQRPDALILTGDLSFNGELASHEEIAGMLGRLKEKGIQTWVIPGNHDINSERAYTFSGKSYKHTANTSPEEFIQIYGEFMGPRSDGGANLSYTVPLSGRLWLAMCDASVYTPYVAIAGYYSEGHETWLKETLAEAKENGIQVILATHQSVIPHTDVLKDNMIVHGGEKMIREMRESGICRLNLSGHLHIQHISEDNGIYDIATGAFAVPPFRYGLIEIAEDGSLSYQAEQICEEHLPEPLRTEAKNWFEEITGEKEEKKLRELGIPEEELGPLLEIVGKLNHAYFSGTLNEETGKIWKSQKDFQSLQEIAKQYSFAGYMIALLDAPENQRDSLSLQIPALPGFPGK